MKMTIGANIKRLRATKEITQEQLSELLQVRRDKLNALVAEGKDPFAVIRYDQDAHSAESFAAHDIDDVAHGGIRSGQREGIPHVHDFPDLTECFAKLATGVESAKIFRSETVRLEQAQGQGIAQGQLHGGGRRGRAADGAGLLHIRQSQYIIGMFSQRAGGQLCNGDEGQTMACRKSDDIRQFLGLSGIGESKDCITLAQHAQISVTGFRRMDEKGGAACGRQSGRYLAGHMAAFAHASDGDTPGDMQQTVHSLIKSCVQTVR